MVGGEKKAGLIKRLNKIEGQVAAIRRMLEADSYCVDVLVQIAAAQGALGRVGHALLGAHMETCVEAAMASGDRARRKAKLDELLDVFARFSRVAAK